MQTMTKPASARHWLDCALLSMVLALLLPGGVSAAFLYDITVDTSAIDGAEGFVDFQFNPGAADAPSAQATVTLFELVGGSLQPSPMIDGAVTGTLPGPVVFDNSEVFNAFLQPVVFGTSLSFRVAFEGDFAAASTTSGTLFTVALLDGNWFPFDEIESSPLSAVIELDLAMGTVTPTFVSSAASVTEIPEPQTWLLLAAGLLVLLPVLQYRRVAARPA
jgi:hypothetical protein